MAFGLTGAPVTFQGSMNATLAPGLRRFVIVLFDDILVFSPTFEAHIDHLRQVFQWLRQDKWKLKMSKCSFPANRFIIWDISSNGLPTDPSKIQVVLDWPVPISVKELWDFLGLAVYYRKFVRRFGFIAKPLTKLLKKDQLFIWNDAHQRAFTLLKQALCFAPIVALLDFTLPFHIETDASSSGIGTVLHQAGHPLVFTSKALSPHNQGLTVYEKGYLAILMAVDQWHNCLLQAEFFIHTDHSSLVHLNEQRLRTAWQQRVFARLLGLAVKNHLQEGYIKWSCGCSLSPPSPRNALCYLVSSAHLA